MKLKSFCKGAAVTAALFLSATSLEASATTLRPPSAAADCQPGGACTKPLPVRVVVVSMFEIGEDTGDAPGEFQLWKERRKLDTRIAFPHSHHDLYYNPDSQILGIVTGMGTAKSTAAIMALGLDQRFDLTHAYWLVAGIAGIDPAVAPIGSAAWAHYVVDGDLNHEIDAREMPKDWPTGYFALDTKFPYDPKRAPAKGEVFEANPKLRDWAYELTKDLKLPNPPENAEENKRFIDYPNAQKPPFVLKGDTLSSMTFFHGKLLNEWAGRWVDYWSDGKGLYATSAMEDTGTMQALTYLDAIGRVDVARAMVLRAGSNYTIQPLGMSAAEHLLAENEGYSGMRASLESLYLVGSKVIDELLSNWGRYKTDSPGD